MPTRVLTAKEREWQLATNLKPFLSPKLRIGENTLGYPVIRKVGFRGNFYEVAGFNLDTKVNIKSWEWEDSILDSIRRYEIEYKVNIGYSRI